MARRRKLTAPSSEDLSRLEEEFRRETPPSALAPIAQVAADAALTAPVTAVVEREAQARDRSAAEAWRTAKAEGRVIAEIPLDDIAPEDMVRDRAGLDDETLAELRASIAENGLRLPVELYERDDPAGGPRYGILSGYRRYMAVRGLLGLSGDATRYGSIKALIRQPGSVRAALTAMVEENEIRDDLSQFERGRIAAITAQTGVFGDVEEAVALLFAQASKAKRSKIRSFARIFEDLGDLLSFPDALTEKQGLRLAGALRAGAEAEMRSALGTALPEDAVAEWACLEAVVIRFEEAGRDPRRGGRPARQPVGTAGQGVRTSTGYRLMAEADARGHMIRIEGPGADRALIETLIAELARVLDRT
jgi:ParB family chromosome partitioning protein